MALKQITAPVEEPISLAEAKLHLHVDADLTEDDDLIEGLIVAARESAEQRICRALMPQVWELTLNCFSAEILLPRPPLVEVESVKFIDTDGVLRTLSADVCTVDTDSEPGRIVPAYGKCWPSTRLTINAVRIRYTAGYANAEAVPRAIRQWMLLQIGTLYANREGVITGASVQELPYVDSLLDRFKVWR